MTSRGQLARSSSVTGTIRRDGLDSFDNAVTSRVSAAAPSRRVGNPGGTKPEDKHDERPKTRPVRPPGVHPRPKNRRGLRTEYPGAAPQRLVNARPERPAEPLVH